MLVFENQLRNYVQVAPRNLGNDFIQFYCNEVFVNVETEQIKSIFPGQIDSTDPN